MGSGFPTIMGDAAGDKDGGSGLPQMDDQEQIQVIQPEGDWWWGGWSVLSVIALVLNFLFLVVIVKNRKNRDLRSLLTAVLITITVLDIVNVLRIVPGIVLNVHKFLEFQLVYCSVGVFHTVAVAVLLVSLGVYLICPCRDAPPLYYPESTCSGSLPQKVFIPVVLLVSGLVGGLMPLLPTLRPIEEDVKWESVLPHSCIDPTRSLRLLKWETDSEIFLPDLYHSLVTLVSTALPLLIIPPTLLVAATRALLHGHCCQVKFKQSAGELLLVFLLTLVYLGTITGSVLPRLDLKMDEFKTELPVEAAHPQVSVLWELGNAALRPTLYFLCHPAVWDGLRGLCCSGKRSYGSVSTKEEEVALAPVMERVSSL